MVFFFFFFFFPKSNVAQHNCCGGKVNNMRCLDKMLAHSLLLFVFSNLATAEDYRRSKLPNHTSVSSHSSLPSMVSWEFKDGSKDGWAAAAPDSMDADVYSVGGELRVEIAGNEPHFDSPRMLVEVPDRCASLRLPCLPVLSLYLVFSKSWTCPSSPYETSTSFALALRTPCVHFA